METYQLVSNHLGETTVTSQKINQHHQRIQTIKTYIENHLGDGLSSEKLAQVAHFPSIHLNRFLTASLGEPLSSFIARLRLKYASQLLIYTDKKIADIALELGYKDQIAFTQAFKAASSLSPLNFRIAKRTLIQMDKRYPKIKEVAPITVFSVREKGLYDVSFKAAWKRLVTLAEARRCLDGETRYFGIYREPLHTAGDMDSSYDAFITTSNEKPVGEARKTLLGGGLYALFPVQSAYENIVAVYDYIFSGWYPQSCYEVREAPSFIEYTCIDLSDNPQPSKAVIYLPIVATTEVKSAASQCVAESSLYC